MGSILLALTFLFTSVGISTTAYAASDSQSLKKIIISKTTKTVYIGQKYKIKVESVKPEDADSSVKWKTSNEKIATVDKNGVVTGKKKGTVTITAVSKNNNKVKAKCRVTVKKFKKTSIDYDSKVSNLGSGSTLIYHDFDDAEHEDFYIIKTYDQLKALKKRIKKTYDIKNFYKSNSVWYQNEKYADGLNGDEILEMLGKYDKKFFKKNILYYNCIDFTEKDKGYDITYSFECTKVEKKISSNGKLTCYMHIKRSVEKTKKVRDLVDQNTSVYLIELKKADISGVQAFKLKHYEYFDLEYIEQTVEMD